MAGYVPQYVGPSVLKVPDQQGRRLVYDVERREEGEDGNDSEEHGYKAFAPRAAGGEAENAQRGAGHDMPVLNMLGFLGGVFIVA